MCYQYLIDYKVFTNIQLPIFWIGSWSRAVTSMLVCCPCGHVFILWFGGRFERNWPRHPVWSWLNWVPEKVLENKSGSLVYRNIPVRTIYQKNIKVWGGPFPFFFTLCTIAVRVHSGKNVCLQVSWSRVQIPSRQVFFFLNHTWIL